MKGDTAGLGVGITSDTSFGHQLGLLYHLSLLYHDSHAGMWALQTGSKSNVAEKVR